jgi:prepilin-type N-terminal cleavage/methylation domain-containing protein
MKFFLIQKNKGFTLIELMVVLTIFIIVTTMVVFDYGSYRSEASIANLTSDISLSIRRAQSYAIGAQNLSSNFSYGYGVHFSTDPTVTPAQVKNGASSNKAFVLFTDVSKNSKYDSAGTVVCNASSVTALNECSEVLNITTTDQISALYTNQDFAHPLAPKDMIDIMFLRPNPDAYFCYKPAGSSLCANTSTSISSVTIEVSSLKLNPLIKKDITVWSTGQISVQ